MLEVTSSADGQQLWRSILGSLLALGGVFVAFGLTLPEERQADFIPYLDLYVVLFFALLFLILLYQWLYIATYYYDLGPDFLRVRKGVIIRQEISVPYSRIQDVYIDQDAIDHVLGLYDVHISTATPTSNLESHIDGVNHNNAEALHEMMLSRIKQANATATTTPV